MEKIINIDQYVAGFPVNIQKMLEQVRATIKKAAPDAEEVISYQMPAFRLNGILVYFAAHKNHIGLYPASTVITMFKNELAGYKTSKGAIQFPYDKPIPFGLIQNIVRFRVMENMEKVKKKK